MVRSCPIAPIHPLPESALESNRTRWWWYLGVPVGIATGAILAVWMRTSENEALTLRRGAQVDTGFTAHLDAAATSNAPTPDGRFLLVVFGYTSCPDVCPTTLLAVHRVLDRLGSLAGQVIPVFVTVDPERDSAAQLKAYAASFDPRIRTLGDRNELAATLRAFRVRAERHESTSGAGYSMDHTAVLYILSPGRRVIAALPESSPALVDDAVKVLRLAATPQNTRL